MNWFRLKTCIKCQGDLAADEGDWICLQCGTYYYTGLYRFQTHIDEPPQPPCPGGPENSQRKTLGVAPATAASITAYSQAPLPPIDVLAAIGRSL